MLTQAGVGDALARWAKEHSSINLIVLAYIVSLIFRIAQGSATVAMQTTSADDRAGLSPGAVLPYHPLYLSLDRLRRVRSAVHG